MEDSRKRLEADMALFAPRPRKQLADIIRTADPNVVAGVIVKVLGEALLIEELAQQKGIAITPEERDAYCSAHHQEFQEQLDKQISIFIGAVVSQEG